MTSGGDDEPTDSGRVDPRWRRIGAGSAALDGEGGAGEWGCGGGAATKEVARVHGGVGAAARACWTRSRGGVGSWRKNGDEEVARLRGAPKEARRRKSAGGEGAAARGCGRWWQSPLRPPPARARVGGAFVSPPALPNRAVARSQLQSHHHPLYCQNALPLAASPVRLAPPPLAPSMQEHTRQQCTHWRRQMAPLARLVQEWPFPITLFSPACASPFLPSLPLI